MSSDHQTKTIWYTRCPVPAASGISIAKGWMAEAFSKHGVAVQSLRHSPEREIRNAHYTHGLDDAFRQGGNVPALYARSVGADTKLIGLSWAPQYAALVCKRESGIESPADLEGKRLALPVRLNDSVDFWQSMSLKAYDVALRSAGLSRDDVDLVRLEIQGSFVDTNSSTNVDPHDHVPRLERQHLTELTALIRDEVDVIFAHSLWGVQMREQFNLNEILNINTLGDQDSRIGNEQPVTLTVSGGLLRDKPDLVDTYVAETQRAALWASRHPDEARRVLASEIGCAEYWLDEGTSPDISSQLTLSFDQILVDSLKKRQEYLIANGFLASRVDFADWIDTGPLERAKAKLKDS